LNIFISSRDSIYKEDEREGDINVMSWWTAWRRFQFHPEQGYFSLS